MSAPSVRQRFHPNDTTRGVLFQDQREDDGVRSPSASDWRPRFAVEPDQCFPEIEEASSNNGHALTLHSPHVSGDNVQPRANGRAIPVVAISYKVAPDARVRILQEWEGEVTEVYDQEFDVILRDLSDRLRPEERATIDVEDVSLGDRSQIKLGAIFYLSISYRTTERGQRRRVSEIAFRRLPAWSGREIKEAQRKAVEMGRRFGVSTQAEDQRD